MNQLLFFSGLNLTSPISASLLQTIAPIVVVIASAIPAQASRLRCRACWALAVGAGGCGPHSFWAATRRRPCTRNATLGNLYILANATVFGLYLVLVRPR